MPLPNKLFSDDPELPDLIDEGTWETEVGDLLAQAAILCVRHGLDVDAYMKGAWTAYVEARPGLRDYIEEMQLRHQLDEMRKNGRMGRA